MSTTDVAPSGGTVSDALGDPAADETSAPDLFSGRLRGLPGDTDDTGGPGEDADPTVQERLRAALGGRARLLLPVLAIVVVGAAGFLQPSGSDAEEPAHVAAPVAPVEVVTEVAEGPVVAVGEVTANLAGPDVHHARVAIAVVLGAEVEPDAVRDRLPVLTDAVVEELARRSYDELSAPEGSDVLRDALTERAHELLGEDTVVRVLLTGLLVQ